MQSIKLFLQRVRRVMFKICLFYVILFLKRYKIELIEILKGNLPLYMATGKERERRIKKFKQIEREMQKKWKQNLS